jgi:hypothetical protein
MEARVVPEDHYPVHTLDATQWPFCHIYRDGEEVENVLEAVPGRLQGLPVLWVAYVDVEILGKPSRYKNNVQRPERPLRQLLRFNATFLPHARYPLARRLKIVGRLMARTVKRRLDYQIAKRTRW